MPSQGFLCTSLYAACLGGAGDLKAGCWEDPELDVVSLGFGCLQIAGRFALGPGTTWYLERVVYKRAPSLTALMGWFSNHSLVRQTLGHLGRGLRKWPCQSSFSRLSPLTSQWGTPQWRTSQWGTPHHLLQPAGLRHEAQLQCWGLTCLG